MKKLRIAQIGTSLYSHGEGIFKTILRFPEIFEVVGYALPEKEREKFPERMAAFAPLAELNDWGYFDSSEDCTTKTPGIFAAGDCRKKQVRQLATAAGDGAVAGLAAIDYLDNL